MKAFLPMICVVWITGLLVGCAAHQTPPAPTLSPSSPSTSSPVAAIPNKGCTSDEYPPGRERIGVQRSVDKGLTWTFLGHACFHVPALVAVDPAPMAIDGGVALYFLDIDTLKPESAESIIYRASSTNGIDFSTPQPAFTLSDPIADPFVLRLSGGDYRLFIGGPEGITSASSSDGSTFTSDHGLRAGGGVPGALLLPNGDVRLFVSGSEGISSLDSSDGLNFTPESGIRILSGGEIVDGPHPIRLRSGSYLMAYDTGPRTGSVAMPWEHNTVIASSADGLNWQSMTTIEHANMPGLVELEDGSLLLYYVDFSYTETNTTPLPPDIPQPTISPTLLKFIQTIRVTPDSQHLTGAFSRIFYLPATDRFIVTFGGNLAQPSGGCQDRGFSYKVYTLGLQETGESGTFACDTADAGSVMVDNTYYFAAMAKQGEEAGWHLLRIDATNWTVLTDQFYLLDYPKEGEGDPMVAFVNGQIDISSGYAENGKSPDTSTPPGSYGTHHHYFSLDLQFQGKRILTAPPHIHGSYMVFVDGIYYLVTANLYDGDVLVAKYDREWNYLGGKIIIQQAHFSTGLVYDGQRFYLAYTDTGQRTEPGFFPVSLNIHLAVFDRDWNLLEDVAVTNYTPQDGMQPGRPWVMLHGNRLYISYDVDTANPITREEHLQWQAYVSVYEIGQGLP